MTEAMGEFVRMFNNIAAELEAPMAAFRDMVPRDWRDPRVDQGYTGNRCGWYPTKPKGWRP